MADRPEVCVGAIAVREGELLMIRRGHGPAGGRWSVPGGRIEHGETAVEALVREVGEETGLSVVCGPFVGWTELISDDEHFVVLDFEVTPLDTQDPEPGDDAAEAAWVPLDEVTDLRLTDGLAEFLADHGILEVLL
jgi:ADP-ribose pyrophosphatase YjhB (NUDIX family)